jgi:hypothetical protein
VSFRVLSNRDLDMTPNFRHVLKMLSAFDASFLIFVTLMTGCSIWSTAYDQVHSLIRKD